MRHCMGDVDAGKDCTSTDYQQCLLLWLTGAGLALEPVITMPSICKRVRVHAPRLVISSRLEVGGTKLDNCTQHKYREL